MFFCHISSSGEMRGKMARFVAPAKLPAWMQRIAVSEAFTFCRHSNSGQLHERHAKGSGGAASPPPRNRESIPS